MQVLRVPQLGEGLREVRIVTFGKNAGEAVTKGEVLYSVETDKSVVELESPIDGIISEWSVGEGDIVAIGAIVALVADADGGVESAETAANGAEAAPAAVAIPPRTRAYAKEKGVSEATLAGLKPADGRKLYPADIDAHLALNGSTGTGYRDRSLSPAQKVLNYRFRRSAGLVIPASLSIEIPGTAFVKAGAGAGTDWLSDIQQLAFAVAAVAANHPNFRSSMLGEETVREHGHVNVGVAVARPNGDLVTCAVKAADTLSPSDFVRAYRQSMRATVANGDQADEDVHILLTTLDQFGIEEAVPTLVAPANSAIFLGARNKADAHKLTMVFDHRLINGVAAARFLSDLSRRLSG